MLGLESKIFDLRDLQMLIGAHDIHFSCCIPGQYKNQRSFQERIDRLEEKLDLETLKPFKPSGHAFVCFDSTRSVNQVLQHYRVTPIQYARLLCLQLKDKIESCFAQCSGNPRDRVQSTFIKFDELDAQVQ